MLKIENLCKRFDEKTVFTDFSFDFEDKGIYALVGESGIGKTTLLRIIAGLDKEYDGRVFGGGIGRVSVAFQEHRLFPHLSAIENVVFAVSDRKDKAVCEKAENILKKLGISEEDFSQLPSALSGGMKQRISLARAIIKEADILLLDEPTKELDSYNADLVRRLILEQKEKRLVIISTHSEQDLLSLGAEIIPI